MTRNELEAIIQIFLPEAYIEEDDNRELIIATGKCEDINGNLRDIYKNTNEEPPMTDKGIKDILQTYLDDEEKR